MPLISCALVHHTGTIIRFRPLQLTELPPTDANVQVELPNSTVVAGHFRRNPANPNISGAGVVQYIKQQLTFGDTRNMLIDVTHPAYWKLYELEESKILAHQAGITANKIEEASVTPVDVGRILDLADRHSSQPQRTRTYKQILRPAALRRLILQLMGIDCQVDRCQAAQDFQQAMQSHLAATAILDVHHIEAVARRVDHHPRNLCVLCANHHRLFHNFARWDVTHDGDDVIMTTGNNSLRIVRDLQALGL